MADRNEVLANFQALSNIEDIGICIDILEQKGWDLMEALNSVLPANNFPQPVQATQPPLQERGVVDLTSSSNGSVSHSNVVDLTRDSLHTQPLVPNNHPQPLPPHFSAGGHFTHPPGLGSSRNQHFPHPPLNLPGPSPSQRRQLSPPPSPPLPPRGGRVVLREGEGGDECVQMLEATLSVTNQSQPRHPPDPPISTVSSGSPSSSTYGDACDQATNSDDEDDEEEEYMDAGLDSLSLDGDFTSDTAYQKAMKEPLIPESCADVIEALQYFSTRFELRYGAMHPLFYVGALREAVREATSGLGNHRPMLVYLHHDSSILSNVFCSQLLCSESVVSYLTSNYITWAWDLTSPQHRKQLLDMIAECFGPMARARVSDIHSDHLPVILIVSKIQGIVDVRNIIQGETNLDGLMTSLITAIEEHNLQTETERKEERERLAREHMIAEQNAAYQQSLQADREKEKKRELQRLQEEEKKQEKEALRQSMESVVPAEPPEDSPDKLATLRIRLPNGITTVQRRFLASHTVQDLLNYVGSMDYSINDYKLLRSYPRTDLSWTEPGMTLEEVGLCPQDTLFLEER